MANEQKLGSGSVRVNGATEDQTINDIVKTYIQ
jgi:hypothetical protein